MKLLSFKEICFECNIKSLSKEVLREMASPTSKQLAKTFTGVLKSLDITKGITEEKLKQAIKTTIERFGLGTKQGLNFKFSKEE
jgi:hypothetical protein